MQLVNYLNYAPLNRSVKEQWMGRNTLESDNKFTLHVHARLYEWMNYVQWNLSTTPNQ